MKKNIHVFLLTVVVLAIIGVFVGMYTNHQKIEKLSQEQEEKVEEGLDQGFKVVTDDERIPGDGSWDRLEINLVSGKVTVLASDTNEIYVDCGNYKRLFQWKTDEDCIILNNTEEASNEENKSVVPEIKVYIPENTVFDSIILNIETGKVENKVFLECNSLDVALMTGNLVFNGKVNTAGKFNVENGDAEVSLKGYDETEYNYQAEIKFGNLNINGSNYSHLNEKKKIDHQAPRNLDIFCNKGVFKIYTEK